VAIKLQIRPAATVAVAEQSVGTRQHAAVLPNSRYDALAVTLPIPNRAGASV
jgi:hypothetical protein